MKLRWDLVGVEKSPACVGGGAPSCGAYSRKTLRPPQQIKCGNADVGSQCLHEQSLPLPRTSTAGTKALVPKVWTRKGPAEAGTKFAPARKMVCHSGKIPRAGIGSRKKTPAEAGQGLILEENQDEDPVSNLEIF